MATDSIAYQHREWLGLLQPVGLVVSPIALSRAQVVIDRSELIELQSQFRDVYTDVSGEIDLRDYFCQLAREVLGWEETDLVNADGIELVLPDYGETLTADFVVSDPDLDRQILLIKIIATGQDLDSLAANDKQGWRATIEEKFERLLRETEIPAGILWNGTHLRLVYAPRGESSGYVTFPLQAMTEVAGRSILGGLVALLGADRLFNVPLDRRLSRLLADSRNYQAEVSDRLAEQVLDQQDLDRERQSLLESLGLHFLRVSDVDVEGNLPVTIEKIRSVLRENPPIPHGWGSPPAPKFGGAGESPPELGDLGGFLETIGQTYYEYRAQLMVENNEGLTATYNRFHDPDEDSPAILKLRQLHAAMDTAVLNAYGWDDLQPVCEFILDYEDEEDTLTEGKSKRKKPYRYRWTEEFHDEVLARLIALNQERHDEELMGMAEVEKSTAKGKKTGGKKKKAEKKPSKQSQLLPAPN